MGVARETAGKPATFFPPKVLQRQSGLNLAWELREEDLKDWVSRRVRGPLLEKKEEVWVSGRIKREECRSGGFSVGRAAPSSKSAAKSRGQVSQDILWRLHLDFRA